MPADHRVGVRLTDAEHDELAAAARAAGLTFSTVVRRSLRATGVLTAAAESSPEPPPTDRRQS